MVGIRRGGLIINLATAGENTQREWGDIRQTANGLRLHLLLRSGRKKVSGPRRNKVFIVGGGPYKTVASMEARWLGREVGSGGGRQYPLIVIIGGQGETRSYEIASPTEPRGRRTLSVAKTEAKREAGTNCDEIH